MCIMSLAAQQARSERIEATRALSVKSTRLFARRDRDDQYLVYQMAIDAPVEVAMVLPLPVSVVADDAIEFLDLSAIPQLFERLHSCFDEDLSRGFRAVPRALAAPKLVVHNVGSFEASWVPTLADMNRLDERFRGVQAQSRGPYDPSDGHEVSDERSGALLPDGARPRR
jgi:hypothetical protein